MLPVPTIVASTNFHRINKHIIKPATFLFTPEVDSLYREVFISNRLK